MNPRPKDPRLAGLHRVSNSTQAFGFELPGPKGPDFWKQLLFLYINPIALIIIRSLNPKNDPKPSRRFLMNVNPTTMSPVMQPTKGCWQSFVSGMKFAGSKIQDGASCAWEGTKKAAIWAKNFFSALLTGASMFVRAYARELIIGGAALASGIAIGLIFSRFGCCNKPAEKVTIEEDQTPQNPLEEPVTVATTTQQTTTTTVTGSAEVAAGVAKNLADEAQIAAVGRGLGGK